MAGTIGQAKMKFSRMVNSRSYSRFNQSQNPDGDGSRVEVKLAVDGEEEEMDGTELGNMQQETYTRSTGRSEPLNKYRILVCVGAALLVFLVGLLIGYSVHRKSDNKSEPLETPCSKEIQAEEPDPPQYEPIVPSIDWSDIVKLLNDKLSSKSIEEQLSVYSQIGRSAGSSVDNKLGDTIHDAFTKLNMEPWVDEHYVKLQNPDSSNPNKVWFGNEEIGSPKGFLAYSETGRREGRVVYANYGEPADLQAVQANEVSLNGTVVLMRAGRISMAQKVMNVAKLGAVAALIYPDPADYDGMDTELYGHVHLGSGDPYTPGFPSFNHTQFAPAKSSGLPEILAQTIPASMARKILSKMGGSEVPSKFKGGFTSYKFGDESNKVALSINNKLVDTKIHNVFGVIKGYVDPDRYVVIGAQRDSMTSGYAKSAVGTTLLMELARVFNELKKEGFKPKRSIVFASWTAGDFGKVGATEWLEGYWASLDRKAFTYISLDGVVSGKDSLRASASPLLHTLLQKTLEKVKAPMPSYGSDFSSILTNMQMDDGAYPFLTFSGIPSVSFSFISSRTTPDYKYFGTEMDTKERLDFVTGQQVVKLSMLAAQVAGQMALRLVHDQILRLDVTKYGGVIESHVKNIINHVNDLKSEKVEKIETLSTEWLIAAKSSYSRAATKLNNDIKNSDLEDMEMCRIINNRIMKVEHNFLSPYVSIRDFPFRHIFFGNGWQTATDLENYLQDVRDKKASFDIDQVLNKFALLTWSIQGCANDLAGDIWSLDNEI
ncbi:transferrin receptor 1b isoform X1 [Danio rerio]|uniref:Transferrin receptor protein 1 n=1 Tax=Danio rerio TaxID=7955 RepID=A0AB32TIL0_DANRE